MMKFKWFLIIGLILIYFIEEELFNGCYKIQICYCQRCIIARPMAEADYCTMGGFIQKLIDDEYNYRQEEKECRGKK